MYFISAYFESKQKSFYNNFVVWHTNNQIHLNSFQISVGLKVLPHNNVLNHSLSVGLRNPASSVSMKTLNLNHTWCRINIRHRTPWIFCRNLNQETIQIASKKFIDNSIFLLESVSVIHLKYYSEKIWIKDKNR